MAENNVTITWDNTPIEIIDRDSLELNKIDDNGTIGEMIDTINANFQNIAKHGGGPAGKDGANGTNGVDGTSAEYIYALSDVMEPGEQYPLDDLGKEELFERVHNGEHAGFPEGNSNITWYEHAQPITEDQKNEYVLIRYKTSFGTWVYERTPVLWAHWGESGTDGDGVEYIFLTSSYEFTDSTLNDLIVKKINLDKYQRAIFQIDDFYPGTGWFIDKNKSAAKKALDAAGVSLSDSNFDQRWRNNFNFVNNYNWSDDPVGTSALVPYEYVSIRRSKKDDNGMKEWTDYSKPALWSSYGLPTRTFIAYYNGTEEKPVTPSGGWWNVDDDILITSNSEHPLLPTGWKNYDEDIDGAIVWISHGVFDHSGENVSWSDPVRITGEKGEKGEDGALMEFIYTLSDTMVKGQDYPSNIQDWKDLFDSVEDPEHPADGITIGTDSEGVKYVDYNGTHWYDRARSITDKKKTEYVWIRTRVGTTGEWTYSDPTIWARWGEDGTDGDGVEYIFHTSTEKWSASAVQRPFERPPLLDNMTGTLGEYCKVVFQMSDFLPNSAWFTYTNKERVRQYIDSLENTSLNGTTLDNKWNDIRNFFNLGWTDNPKGTDMTNLYEYVSIRRSKTVDGVTTWGDFSQPALWSNYNNKSRVFIVYYNSETEDEPETPTGGFWDVGSDRFVTNDPSHPLSEGWSDTDREEIGKYTWMSSGAFHENDYIGDVKPVWSKPHRITGADGEKGKDGTNIEFIYALCNVREMYPGTHYPTAGTGNVNWENLFNTVEDPNNPADGVVVETDEEGIKYVKYGEVHWYDRALSITEENKVEFCWSRYKTVGTDEWQYDQKPFIWAHWGEDGTDGDGVEYIFALSENEREFNNWDTNTAVSGLSELETLIYSSNDFCPNSEWFDNSTIKSRVQTEIQRKGYTISSADFDAAWISMKTKFSFDVKGLGSWTDNPSDISPNYPYQYVSIRKSPDGVWTPFSSPKLWTKYNNNRYTSFVFTAVKPDEDLSQFTVIGGSFDNPIPNPPYGKTLNRSGVEVEGITWTDNPQPDGVNTEVWMISAKLMEGYTAPEGVVYPEWSKPKRMADSSELNIEWSANSLTPEQVTKLNDFLSTEVTDPNDPEKTYCPYNFGVFMSQYDFDEAAAEAAWRTAVHDAVYVEPDLHYNINFSDNAEEAVLMATCQMKNGVWSNWKVTRVKGEKGDTGTHIVVKGRISHEVYMPDGVDYIYSLVNDEREHATLKNTPREGDLLIVYPHEPDENGIYLGDSSYGYGLYMWKYENRGWVDYNNKSPLYDNNEDPNNTYTSPNNHMIIWDGDSWQDVGEIHGPVGPECKVLVKYANDDPDTGEKVFVSNKDDIPAAKWIGVLTYTEGSEDPESFTESDPKWNWSLFKGQDGYGYEYIYKQTADEVAPVVPTTTPAQDSADGSVPSGWDDEPIEPTLEGKYIWMCWRRFNTTKGKWEKFVGKDGKTSEQDGVARLWQIYVNSISNVLEYFHADESVSPSGEAYSGDPTEHTDYWKTDKNDWNATNRYLFNKEVIVYTDGTTNVLEPHFIAVWVDGILDVEDYYIVESKESNNSDPGEIAPRMNADNTPIIASSTGYTREGKDYWTKNVTSQGAKTSKDWPVLWNISKRIYDGDKAAEWSSPIVVGVYGEGSNGVDSVYIDLDNEMDTIQIDNENKVVNGNSYETTVTLYKGADKTKMKDIDTGTLPTGITCTRTYYNGTTEVTGVTSSNMYTKNIDSVKLTFNIPTGTILDVSSKIVISATSIDDVTRKTSYTIAGSTLESVYSIIPSDTAIIKNSSSLSTNQITISVVEFKGNTSTEHASVPKDSQNKDLFKLYVKKNNGTKEDITSSFTKSTSGLVVGDKLTFTVEVDGNNDGTYETVADKETIFVLLQGENGERGDSVSRKYAQYDNTNWGSFGSIVSISSTGSTVTFKNSGGTSKTASTTDYPQGADADHSIEVMSEKIGNGSWSFPVIVAKYFNQDDINTMVNASLSGSNEELNQLIQQKAGEQISSALGPYAKTSDISTTYATKSEIPDTSDFLTDDDLPNMDDYARKDTVPAKYTSSAAFSTYKSDAAKKTAQAEILAANSTFARNSSGYFLLSNGTASSYNTIEGYYNAVKSEVDPSNKTLDDPDVVKALITKMESTFRKEYTELATVKTSVNDKMSQADIIAAINSGSSTIKAAITAYANSAGSGINLTADRILLSAEKQLNLTAGTFTINSSNFTLDGTGITLQSSNGKTSLGSDGILRATGAVISGTITANTFAAEDNNRETNITSDTFQIADKSSGNNIYIAIKDNVKDPNNNTIFNSNVPTLCMTYNGEEYILNPLNWYNTAQDNSAMGFKYRFDLKQYYVKGTISNTNTSTWTITNVGSYKIFKESSYGITENTSSMPEKLYQFYVSNLGTNSSNVSNITSNGLASSSATNIVTINSTGAYTHSKPGDSNGAGGHTGSVSINSTNCITFKGYLTNTWTNSSYKYGLSCLYEYTQDSGSGSTSTVTNNGVIEYTNAHGTSLTTSYGLKKFYSYLLYHTGLYGNTGYNWAANGNLYCIEQNVAKKLLFDYDVYSTSVYSSDATGGTNGESELTCTLNFYPILAMTDLGKSFTSTKDIWFTCVYHFTWVAAGGSNIVPISTTVRHTSANGTGSVTQDGTKKIYDIDLTLSFNVVLTLDTAIGGSTPEAFRTNALSKINTFLSNFDKVGTADNNQIKTYVNATGHIELEGDSWTLNNLL